MTERDVIGIFGKMNSGKSSLMNLITQQESSIVDAFPGTTADTKVALMEIHGIGPVKLLDTAGFDEENELGFKKRKKITAAVDESDMIILVINPAIKDFEQEKQLINTIRKADKQLLVIYNIFNEEDKELINEIENSINELRFYNKITSNLTIADRRPEILNFIVSNYIPRNPQFDLLPFIKPDEFYILNIPMDEETPPGRLLRPQSMAEEYIVRHWAYPVCYRMNLQKAREGDPGERRRWDMFINSFIKKPKAIITDSQAMDIMKDWSPEDMDLTTFSIMMINYMSRGRLESFIKGVRELKSLNPGDKILISEACNHSRIREDIGTIQIPRLLKRNFPELIIEHALGREFAEKADLNSFRLVIHCGGCMITPQKMSSRLRDLECAGVPITNYGIILSYLQGKDVMEKVIKPWKVNYMR